MGTISASTAATPASPTPILDRQAPLPPLAAPGSGASVLLGVGIGFLIVIPVIAAIWVPSWLPSVRQQLEARFPELFPDHWTAARIAAFGLMALLVASAAVAVHETGHVLGGLCAGFRFSTLRIGPLMIHRGFRIPRHRGWGAWLGGAASMIPVKGDRLAERALLLVSAGPAASILSGCFVLLLPSKGLSAWSFGVASVVGGLADLVPFRAGSIVLDGRESGCCSDTGSRANDGWRC